MNLLDFNPEKLTIDKELNSIHNTPDASSKDLIDIYQVRYDDGGFYLTIDNIKGYFKLDGDISGVMIKKINIIKCGKKFLNLLMIEMEN